MNKIIKQILDLNPEFEMGNIPKFEGYYIVKLVDKDEYDCTYYLSPTHNGLNCRWLKYKPEEIEKYTIFQYPYRGVEPYKNPPKYVYIKDHWELNK